MKARGFNQVIENVITNNHSSNVMNTVAKPYFKVGSYGEGIYKAYSVFASNIANHYNVKLLNNRETGYRYNFNSNHEDSNNSDGISEYTAKIIAYILLAVIVVITFIAGAKDTSRTDYNRWNDSSGGGSSGDSGGFGGGSSDGGGSSGDW